MNERQRRRSAALDQLVDDVALEEFERYHGTPQLAPVAIVIAAYHEADNIGHVVENLPTRLCGLEASVIVVVDGDDDGTSDIVRKAGRYCLIAPVNRGQGAALRLGYRSAMKFGARYIVTADADGQTDPSDLEVVLSPVVDGSADFVNGSRRLGTNESHDYVRALGVVVYAAVISLLTKTKVTDTANPVRAMTTELASRLRLTEPQFQASELLIGAIMSGARFSERPVRMRQRRTGASKKGGNFTYGLNYGRVVSRTWLRERRIGAPKTSS